MNLSVKLFLIIPYIYKKKRCAMESGTSLNLSSYPVITGCIFVRFFITAFLFTVTPAISVCFSCVIVDTFDMISCFT